MGYLISQIIFCLIIAAVLGVALGWLLHGMLHHQVNDSEALRGQLNHCMNENHRLRTALSTTENIPEPPPFSEINSKPIADTPSEPSLSAPDDTEELEVNAQSISELEAPELSSRKAKDEDSSAPEQIDLITRYQTEIAKKPRLIGMLENSEPFTYEIEEIEGIGKGFGARLRNIGINQTLDLLSKGHSIVGCNEIADKTQVETFVVKKWVTQADLLRLPGIRGKFAELLQASHIESVEALAKENATSLTQKMREINDRGHRSPLVPSAEMVSDWISSAQKTPPHTTT